MPAIHRQINHITSTGQCLLLYLDRLATIPNLKWEECRTLVRVTINDHFSHNRLEM